jgi:hypothetical protein
MLASSPLPVSIATFSIPTGDAGIEQTVQAMLALIADGAAQPIVAACAQAIVEDAGCGDRTVGDRYRQIAAVRSWAGERWCFVLDHELPALLYHDDAAQVTELLHAPDAQLARIAATGQMIGDCDCAAILTGALCRALGCSIRILCVGFSLDSVPAYVHTWCEARPFGGDEFLELDITRTSQRLPGEAITRAASWSLS